MNNMKFAVIGGDARQIWLARELAADGHTVRLYGLEKCEGDCPRSEKTIDKAVGFADCVILPFPVQNEHGWLNAPFAQQDISPEEVLDAVPKNSLVTGGRVLPELSQMAKERNLELIDYGLREELIVLNAIPSAEGAIQICMEETPFTIHGADILVMGYGRIGKVLSAILHHMGAKVTVSARKASDLAWIETMGYKAIHSRKLAGKLSDFQVIFNTVPAMLLTKPLLEEISNDCLIIDLASRPGGVDFDAAAKLSKRVIWALSLPGKVAPATAGNIIKTTIYNIIKEREEEP